MEKMIIDYIVELGLDAIRNEALTAKQQQDVSKQLAQFIEQQEQINTSCSHEEELDFAGLAGYIRTNLLADVQILLFGAQKERVARQEIVISKAMVYAQAETKLSQERAKKMIEDAISILRNFYKAQMSKELILASVEIEDTISDTAEHLIAGQTAELTDLIRKSIDLVLAALQNKSYLAQEEVLRHSLTASVATLADKQSVLHREHELHDIMHLLTKKKAALLLSGFGGIGKTALARMLYTKLSDEFDCIGWVEYHKSLKDSLLSSIELYEEIVDQESRWRAISTCLKNNPAKKIIFIDNVDRDAIQMQDPTNDPLLQEVTGWRNTTIILTSRISELYGYQLYPIGPLGSEHCPQACVDLFYYYFDKDEYKKPIEERQQYDAVVKLVARAGFHTYAIELLARSAKYENNLFDYYEKIKKLGFQFPSLLISTARGNDSAPAAKQLRLLFNTRSRSIIEQQILWDFSVLPEGTRLSASELKELLNYTENDLNKLCEDGWLRFERGEGFYIHPLVKEVVHFDLNNGKAPVGTAVHLLTLVRNNTLISDHDTQSDIFRKLHLVETVEKYITFNSDEESELLFYNLGLMEYRLARKRLTGIMYLKKALQCYQLSHELDGGSNSSHIANIIYQIGYIKSTTHQYRTESKDDLKNALSIWQSCEHCQEKIAMAHDHLGYVLTDSPETYELAKKHLTKALYERDRLAKSNPTPSNRYAFSTTCDNLGYLLYKSCDEIDEAMQLLKKALSIREDLYKTSSKYATDVAWTLFNLGKLLSKNSKYHKEAEMYFKKSLDIRRELEQLHPQMYTTNIVFTLVSLAKLISSDGQRVDEVQEMYDEAITLKSKIDNDHMGFFSDDIESDIQFLSEILYPQR